VRSSDIGGLSKEEILQALMVLPIPTASEALSIESFLPRLIAYPYLQFQFTSAATVCYL
jgi:hypothetical protein